MKAITTYAEPCWTLVHDDGRPVGSDDLEPHFDTEEKALKAVASYRDEDRPDPTPKRLADLCSVATAACGYTYDEEGEGLEHWSSADELHTHLLSAGWRDLVDGQMSCGADPGWCEECEALAPTPAAAHLPGQLELIPLGTGSQSPAVGR